MPSRPPRACAHPGCRSYSYDGGDWCAEHRPKRSGWRSYNAAHGKTSRHEAGYGADWDKLRLSILARDRYLCQVCRRLGVDTEARHVDHIINKALGGDNSPDNLQAICVPCHKRKTKREAKLGQYGARDDRV